MAVGTKFPALPLFPTTNLGTIIDIISKVLSEMLYLPIGKYFETILHWWLMWVLRSFTAVLTAIEPLPCMHTLPKIRSGWSRFKPFWNGCISKTVRPRALKLKKHKGWNPKGFGTQNMVWSCQIFDTTFGFRDGYFVRWRHLDRMWDGDICRMATWAFAVRWRHLDRR